MNILDYAFNLPTYAAKDLQSMGTDLRTAGSELIKPIITTTNEIYKAPKGKKLEAAKKAFAETINNDRVKRMAQGAVIGASVGSSIPGIGTLGGTITGGLAGLVGPKNLADSVLSTYNTSVNDIVTGEFNLDKAKRLASGAARGALEHPVYAAMDLSLIPGLAKGAGKAIKATGNKTGPVQELLSSGNLGQFNRDLSNAKLSSQIANAGVYTGYNKLARKPLAKRSEYVNQITRNKSKLSTKDKNLAEEIKRNLIANEKARIELGELDPIYTKNNTVAQYVMAEMEGKNNLLHKDIMDIIEVKPLDDRAKAILSEDKTLGNKVLKLIDKGEQLYDNGNIAFLSQELANTTDPLGIFSARKYNLENPTQYGYQRAIGRATPEMIGNVLDNTIRNQLNDTTKARVGIDILRDALDSSVIKLTKGQKLNAINSFKKSIAKDIQFGQPVDLKRALGATDLDKLMDNTLYKALHGVMDTPKANWSTRALNSWKRVVLANPGWVAGNRLGNWSNNAIAGVGLDDIIDAKRFEKYAPEQLRQQTSYNAMMSGEDLATKDILNVMAEPLTDVRRSIGEFKNSKKGLGDYGKLASDLIAGTSNIVTNPFFKMEAQAEFIDRYVNYVMQARKYANKNNKSLEWVLKKAQSDRKLFGELNNKVNKSLGDYYGKNYAMPEFVRNVVSESIPFYRFPAQTVRTTLNQLGNNPYAFATNISIPARGGHDIYQDYLDKYNLNPEYFKGGSVYARDNSGNIKTFGLTPPPIGIIGERFTNLDEAINSLAPGYTNVKDALQYKKLGRTPTSPTLEIAKLLQGVNPEFIKLVENYKGTKEQKKQVLDFLKANNQNGSLDKYIKYIGNENVTDRDKYMIEQLLNNTVAPYILMTRYMPGPFNLARGTNMQTKYDVDVWKDYPEGRVKTNPVELVGNWIGINSSSLRPEKPMSKSKIRKGKKNAGYAIKNIKEQRGKK